MSLWWKLNPQRNFNKMKYPSDERKSGCTFSNERFERLTKLSSFDEGLEHEGSNLDFYFLFHRLDNGVEQYIPVYRRHDEDYKYIRYYIGHPNDECYIQRPYQQRFKTTAGLIRFIYDYFAKGGTVGGLKAPVRVKAVRLEYGRDRYWADLQG